MNPNIQKVASDIMLAAHVEMTQEVLLLLLERTGLQEVDGLPAQQWIFSKLDTLTQRHVLKIGDTHPEIAEEVAVAIRAARGKQ